MASTEDLQYTKKKVLLVEDSRFEQLILSDLLKGYGFEVETASDGDEAIKKACEIFLPDVVLMDIELKGSLDGIDTAKMILKRRDVPIIFLTANASSEVIERIKSIKAYGYILKGTDKKAVIPSIEMAIKLHEAYSLANMFMYIYENSTSELYVFDPETLKFIKVNKSARMNLRYTEDELLNMTPIEIKPEFTKESFVRLISPLLEGKMPEVSFETIHRRKDGTTYPVKIKLQLFDYKGRKLCLASGENIAERLKFERAIKEKEKLYFELAENAPIGILRCDRCGNILYVNSRLIEILGSPGEEETKKINLLTFPPLVEQGLSGKLEECLKNNEVGTYELEYTSKWGKRVWIRVHIKPEEEDGKVSGALIIVDDITEKKEMEKELYLLSITDALTGAYNRRYLLSKLEEEIERAKRYGEEFSIILLDIDNFKKINDCYGHIMGDEALRRVAKVVRERIRKLDVFGRWGGEEFVIVLPGTPVEKAAILAEDLRRNIADIVLPCNERITASFGVTEYEKGDTIDSLIKRADDLMYKSKNEGKNKVNYL